MTELMKRDSVNSIVILRDTGWYQIYGPFDYTVDGIRSEVILPLSGYWEISDNDERAAGNSVDEKAVVMADGEVVTYGKVVGADRFDDEMIVAVKNIAVADS